MVLCFYNRATSVVAACFIFIEPRYQAAWTKAALYRVTRNWLGALLLPPATCCGMMRVRALLLGKAPKCTGSVCLSRPE